ncbi:MAG: DUF5117 domain-containing protein [Gammaproteobacteria bacterium]|nr:DUF5117 domain-containing protein [Gammaproteobacteria bacterium]
MSRLTILLSLLIVAACGGEPAKPGDKPGLPADAAQQEGFVDLYWDDAGGRLYLGIAAIDEPMIYVGSLARGVGSNDIGLDRGQLGRSRLVRFERTGPRVLLVADNPNYAAHSDNAAERRAVEESFARSVLWGFDVIEDSDNGVVIDATDFFLRDSHGIATTLRAANEGEYQVDNSRSSIYLPRTKAFPDNTEIEATVTFTGTPAGQILSTVVPDPSAITVHLHHSFVRLPEPGYQPLRFDPRAGYIDPQWFGLGHRDYASEIGEPLQQTLAMRHRLEKQDPTASSSPAVEPIVYYVDRGAPEPVRQALIDGASWWNDAFTAAGYENAFRVELLPDGADPLDARYNVIQWVHRSTRGWSYGSGVVDPRTGEIIKGHVTLGSLRIRQDYLLAEGLLAPYTDGDIPPAPLAFALARIRQLSAHEVGHTLGIGHNFAASTDDRASVMDYPHPLVTIDDAGNIDVSDAYDDGIGKWDERAILWGYQDFPDDVDAAAAREQIINETYAMGLDFVDDVHSRSDAFAKFAGPAHPLGSLWDNGNDAVAELGRLMRVRERVLAQFSEATIRTGRPLAMLEDVLVPAYLMHRYQIEAAATLIGGQYFSYARRGDELPRQRYVTAARQDAAIGALLATVQPAALRLRPELVNLIPPRPPGQGASRELFPRHTGYVFDPLAAAETAAGLTINTLLDHRRAARMNNAQRIDPALPGFDHLLQQTMVATWYASPAQGADAELARLVNSLVLQRLLQLAGNAEAQSQVRALAFDSVVELDEWLRERIDDDDPEWRAHYRFAQDLVRRFAMDSGAMPPGQPVAPPPGSPIG